MRRQLKGTRQLDDEAREEKKERKKKCNFVTGEATTPLWNTCDGPTVYSLDNRLLSVKD